ncbi:hypothetical protein BD289DRAFT_448711 [Coniella lustricola]|uniref:Tim44-like domain-containing protein n=1 Tax=Coniella lustricola TaxID=2025994 RepID=A0A2T2ZRX7_9PEZI|nr:hypothetical protein BD289DRAFT_448711 [Coniella lustricola]
MAATFRTRPLLMAASAARPAFSSTALSARGLLANSEQIRQYAANKRRIDPRFRNSIAYMKKRSGNQEAVSTTMNNLMSDEKNSHKQSELAMLAPRTIVPLPFSKVPKDFNKFCRYYWHIIKQRFADRVQIFQATMATKTKFWERAKYKPEIKSVPDVALALHAAMSESMALGTPEAKQKLAKICATKLQRSLLAALEVRPDGKRYRWERLAVTGKPRVVDHKWSQSETGTSVPLSFRQAVVRIASRQRLTELNAKGDEISSKEMDLVEYLVLWRRVHVDLLKEDDWVIYGTLKESTLEALDEEMELIESVSTGRAKDKLLARQRELDAQSTK